MDPADIKLSHKLLLLNLITQIVFAIGSREYRIIRLYLDFMHFSLQAMYVYHVSVFLIFFAVSNNNGFFFAFFELWYINKRNLESFAFPVSIWLKKDALKDNSLLITLMLGNLKSCILVFVHLRAS